MRGKGMRRARFLTLSREGRAFLSTGLFLLVVGLGLILSNSSAYSVSQGRSPFSLFLRQVAYVPWALLGCLGVARLGPGRLRRLAPFFLVFCLLLLLAVFTPLGRSAGGATRWIQVGFVQGQPSELAKVALVLFGSRSLSREGTGGKRFLPLLLWSGLFALLTLLQRDLGTAVLLAALAWLLLFLSGAEARVLLGLALLGVAGGLVATVIEPYRFARIQTWLRGGGYQVRQAAVFLGSGGLFGKGPGGGRGKWGFVPNNHTDFAAVGLGEEMGLMGISLALFAYTFLFLLGRRVAMRARDPFGYLLALGASSAITLQAFLNLAAVLRLLPVTGIPLPLVSYGVSSLISSLLMLGFVLAVDASSARGGRLSTKP